MLAQQYWRYGWSRVQTVKSHPHSLRLRHTIAPIFVAALPLILLASALFAPLRGVWLILTLAYLATIGTVSLYIAQHTQVRSRYVFLAIVTIHVVWGLGFWRGLFVWNTP